MPPFSLTPIALSDLSLLILVVFVIGYPLVLIRRAWQRGEKPLEMALLAEAFGGIAGAILPDVSGANPLPRRRPTGVAPDATNKARINITSWCASLKGASASSITLTPIRPW
jgi:hypothetical protein